MTKKQWALVAIPLILVILYIHYFSSWFKPKIIYISYTERPLAARSRNAQPLILFGFGGQRFRLSEIEVVPLAAWQTNQSVPPLWHLIAKSRSAPVEFFQYGQNIPGMKSAGIPARPELLESNVIYRLFIRAGSVKGQCDFQLGGHPSSIPANRN